MTLAVDKTAKKTASPAADPALRFIQLQQAIRKKQQSNASLRSALETLADEYRIRILPVEQRLEEPLVLLAERLIDFFGRKSLQRWQREELMVWIAETLNNLSHMNPAKTRELDEVYRDVLESHFEMSLDELLGHADGVDNDDNGDSGDIGEEPDNMDSIFEELFEKTHSSAEREREESRHKGSQQQASAATPDPNDWIKSLFRRTARVLHPDREQDPVRREEKHHLMAQLVAARDSGDVMTLLMLFGDHVAGQEGNFAAEEYPAIVALLQQQLKKLDLEKDEIVHANPFHHFLYRQLYSKQKATRERKMKTYLAHVEADWYRQMDNVVALRNLKVLKQVLEERAQRNALFDFPF